jgi:hypothetical protein
MQTKGVAMLSIQTKKRKYLNYVVGLGQINFPQSMEDAWAWLKHFTQRKIFSVGDAAIVWQSCKYLIGLMYNNIHIIIY